MSLADLTSTSLNNKYSQDLVKKFEWAIKRVASEHGTDNETSLTQEELTQLIQTWEPQRDIICLYVRWARQLRRNFNLDSIATLLCLSRQCGYTPVDFIRKVKTLSIHRNHKATYGVTFHFDIPHRKDINRERLNKEFLGLSVTLALLQEQITTSSSVLGKTQMRQSSPRTSYPMNIPIQKKNMEQASIVAHPTIEFHTQSSLFHRIWMSINHRWLAFYIIEHLFHEVDTTWSYLDALIYTFQMMAPCGPGRFEFLSPLVGYCLRFGSQESIKSKRSRLRAIWNDPATFMSYGNTCLTQLSSDVKSRIIGSCFHDLRSDIPSTSKQISYNRDSSWHRRWTILRAYIFHFWLESAANNSIKSLVVNNQRCPTTTARKRRKTNESVPFCLDMSSLTPTTTVQCTKKLATPPTPPSENGFETLTSSRRKSMLSSSNITCNTAPPSDIVGGKQGPSQPFVTPANIVHVAPFKNTNWMSLRLISTEEMRHFVQSYLLIHRTDGVDVLAELSSMEVYSANNLHDLVHCRLTGKSPFSPSKNTGPVVLHIGTETEHFVDTAAKSFHVAREHSEYFMEHTKLIPSMKKIQSLCHAIVCHGYVDSKRAIGQYRVNIGNGGQNWVNGSPCQLHGMKFQKDLEDSGQFDAATELNTIGQITEFTWRVMCSLQDDASDHPIAPDTTRKKLYAERLNEYLNIDSEVGFEDITLVVSSLHPTMHEVREHKDTMNDTVAGYTRTAAFNMVFIDENDACPTIVHFQVICNFRKVIGDYILPFRKYIVPVARHARQYLDKWNHSIQSVYAGKTEKIPSAYDRSAFFLDDVLEYTMLSISEEGKHKQSISAEYILTEVSISRTLSLSMFIDRLTQLQHLIKFDQTIELAFACSFLSNPFWFDWCISLLIQRHEDPNNDFVIGLHPFYDWSHYTIEIFGGWQGGPHNRWSPCGGSKETILETFGAQPGASEEERQCGERKLTQVIAILWEHVKWINSLSGHGEYPIDDLPLAKLKANCEHTLQEISKVASCQFSHFRLGILTTILAGCGLLKEGKHLRNLMYPVKGSASFKHLCQPIADFMSPERARALGDNKTNESVSNDGRGVVREEHQDLFMQYLSAELGFGRYLRDEIECILCESHPMRSLNCRDWFRKGMALYDCNADGEFFQRAYGRHTTWVKLHPPQEYEFAYLGTSRIEYIALDAQTSYYAAYFGNELRSKSSKDVVFKGRKSKTSGHKLSFTNNCTSMETFDLHNMQMADFYVGSHVKRTKVKSMYVLGDAEHAVKTTQCNNLEDYHYGQLLFRHLQTLPISKNQLSSAMAAGCYHMDSETNNNSITFFPGHLDKPFVHTAWFVPLGTTAFFTIISVPQSSAYIQDVDSLHHFQEWKAKLSTTDSKSVDDFLREFDVQAKRFITRDSPDRLVFLNKCGSVLSFPANNFYHATIIPKKPIGFPRDLMVFHPLDGSS